MFISYFINIMMGTKPINNRITENSSINEFHTVDSIAQLLEEFLKPLGEEIKTPVPMKT